MIDGEWQQALRQAEGMEVIYTQIGRICDAHNRLHYIVMHFASHLKYGTSGEDSIVKIYQEGKHTFSAAIELIRKSNRFPQNKDSLLLSASKRNDERNYIVHGLLMEKVEKVAQSPDGTFIYSNLNISDEDRLGFGKPDIKTGSFITKSLRELGFWDLHTDTLALSEILREELEGIRVNKNKRFA